MNEEHKFSEFLHKMVNAGWGFISLSEEKTRTFINDLVKRGEISSKEGEGLLKNMMEKLETTGKDLEAKVSDLVKRYVTRESLCTKTDLAKHVQRIEGLEKRIEALEKQNKKQ
jgi:polyhydroxyalkanoate synthesis regulator phasin